MQKCEFLTILNLDAVLAYLHENIKVVSTVEEITANWKKWVYNLFNDADSVSDYKTGKDGETMLKEKWVEAIGRR
jgi:hypothetical protein